MTRRDVIAEIEGKRLRSKSNEYRFAASARLLEIRNEFADFRDWSQEAKRYVPIGIAACVEGFARGIIKELCDHSDAYLNNALGNKSIQIDRAFIGAIQYKRVTGGEIVAHLLPISSVENILGHLKDITGIDFFERMKNGERDVSLDYSGEMRPYIADFARVISDLRRIYEARHSFVHEIDPDININHLDILSFLDSSGQFLSVIGEIVDEIIYGKTPRTQIDMNIKAFQDVESLQKELQEKVEKIIEYLKDFDPQDENDFKAAQDAWEAFVESDSSFEADHSARGGTMRSTIYGARKSELLKQRLESLSWLFNQSVGEPQ